MKSKLETGQRFSSTRETACNGNLHKKEEARCRNNCFCFFIFLLVAALKLNKSVNEIYKGIGF